MTLTTLFTNIANAIRAKKGTSAPIVAEDFPDEISSISGGGSSPYTELEYIEGTGNQYIDTGVSLKDVTNYEIEFKFKPTNITDSYNEYLTVEETLELFISNGGSLSYKFGGKRVNNFLTVNTNTIYDLKITYNSNNVTITNDGTQIGTISNVGPLDTSTSLLFLRFYAGFQTITAKAKVYKFKISINGEVVQDYVPSKISAFNIPYYGNIGMYDKANNNFYINSGTGSFIAGPEV